MRPLPVSSRSASVTNRTLSLYEVFHASELILLFGQFPAVEQEFATQMVDFYVNFINDLNPGGERCVFLDIEQC